MLQQMPMGASPMGGAAPTPPPVGMGKTGNPSPQPGVGGQMMGQPGQWGGQGSGKFGSSAPAPGMMVPDNMQAPPPVQNGGGMGKGGMPSPQPGAGSGNIGQPAQYGGGGGGKLGGTSMPQVANSILGHAPLGGSPTGGMIGKGGSPAMQSPGVGPTVQALMGNAIGRQAPIMNPGMAQAR